MTAPYYVAVVTSGVLMSRVRSLCVLLCAAVVAACSDGTSPATTVTVTSVSPGSGPLTGGTAVTVTGADFPTTVDSVRVGTGRLRSLVRVSGTQLNGNTPAGSATGATDVAVYTTSAGNSTCTGCFTYTQVTVTDVAGEWVFKDYAGPEDVCSAAGAFVFSQTGATLRGTAARYAGGCPANPAVVDVTDGQVSDTGITFTFGSCPYTGTFKGARRDSLAGTFSCAPPSAAVTGTWVAARAGPAVSLALGPSARTMVVGGTTTLCTALTDAAGHPLYGRLLTWANDDPAAVAVTTLSATCALAAGIGPGSATVTATAAGLSARVSFVVRTVRYASVSAGFASTCGVSVGGDAYCWGGELGDSTNSSSRIPVGVFGSLAFSSVSRSYLHSCGVATGGAAYCWGVNDYGQLGNGSTAIGLFPVVVAGGLTFVALSAGDTHTCGVVTSGAAYCWGSGGQLGGGSTVNSATPVAVLGGLAFAAVSAGTGHTCGVTTSGAAHCWGSNWAGQLGSSSPVYSSTPVAVLGGLTLTGVSAGYDHTCGVAVGGAAFCWGGSFSGQLGNGAADTTLHSTPVAVAGGLTFAAVDAGAHHTCGVTTNGAAYCWGRNDYGQLGNGSTVNSAVPVAVLGGLTFAAVSAGNGHTCGVTTSGAAYCWGWNPYGQLGNGSTAISTTTPVPVAGQ